GRGAVEASPLESLALLGAQRTRRVAAVLGEASDRGRVEPALEREHAERDRARGVLVHQEGGGGFAPQRVIDQAGDRGTVAGTGEAVREPPVLERVGGRTPPRLDVGEHVNGGGKAGTRGHAAQVSRSGGDGKGVSARHARSWLRLSEGDEPMRCWPLLGSGAGWARLFPSPRNEGSDAPRRRVVRITPDGPDDHTGRTRIAGSWRISGCAAPTRRATRHLPLSRSRPVGPSPRSLVRGGAFPSAAGGRDVCGVTLAGAASRPTAMTPHESAPQVDGTAGL